MPRVAGAACAAATVFEQQVTVNGFIGSFKHSSLLRDGYAPPPPEAGHPRLEHDKNLAHVLRREFLWKNPKWVPHTVAEERLLVGCLFALKAAGWGVGEHCWAAVIQIHASFRNTARAEQAFRMMQRDALIRPTSLSFGKLAVAYGKEPNLPKLKHLWRCAVGRGVTITPSFYAALMNCFVLLNRPGLAWDAFRYVVAKKEVAITSMIFGPLFRAAESPEAVQRTLSVMRLFPDAPIIKYHVAYALEAVARAGITSDAVSIEDFRAMMTRARDVLRDATAHDERLLCEAQQWILALQALATDINYFAVAVECMEDTVADLPSNACIALTKHCVNVNCVATAERAFTLLPSPKASSFAVLMSLYVQNKLYARVEAVWAALEARGIQPNRVCCALYIQACGDRSSSTDDSYVREAERAFREAGARGQHQGDSYLWAMMMRVYWKVGDAKKARALDRERKRMTEPKGKIFAGYFRDVSPGPTPTSSQVWEDLPPEPEPVPPPEDSDTVVHWRFEDLDPVHDGDADVDGPGPPASPMVERRKRIRAMAWTRPPPVTGRRL